MYKQTMVHSIYTSQYLEVYLYRQSTKLKAHIKYVSTKLRIVSFLVYKSSHILNANSLKIVCMFLTSIVIKLKYGKILLYYVVFIVYKGDQNYYPYTTVSIFQLSRFLCISKIKVIILYKCLYWHLKIFMTCYLLF